MTGKNKYLLYFLGALLLFISACLSVRLGSETLSWREFFMGLIGKKGFERITFVLWNLRFPRMLAAVVAGVGLSVSGLALQNLTGNELAGPNIIGVNAGAGFFVILGMYFMPGFAKVLPLLAFLGAFLATLFILLLSFSQKNGKNAVILAGVAVTALLNAGISLISRLDTDLLTLYNDFSVGGISEIEAKSLILPSIMIVLSMAVLLLFSKDIDAMMLGDGISRSLGVNVRLVRLIAVLSASAAAGAVVSVAGLLGFVGLIVPHMARKMIGASTGKALFLSALLGAIMVLIADIAGRSLFSGTEIPVGIVMALIGVPFFLYLIIRRREA